MTQIQNDSLLNDYKSGIRSTFTLTTGEIDAIFENILPTHIAEADAFLNGITGPDKLVISKSSDAYKALVSLAFNNASKLLGSGLKWAINNGNRAEAWFQIRYGSNSGSSASGGIAKRRYYESDLFGVFANENSPTEHVNRVRTCKQGQVFTIYLKNINQKHSYM
jgi:hypothetical protein